MASVIRTPASLERVELLHKAAPKPRIRFMLTDRGYDAPGKDSQWVATDGTGAAEWGRFFEKEDIREFANALLDLVGRG